MTHTDLELFAAAFEPAGLSQLREHFDQGACLIVQGRENKFDGLVSLLDIERRLNDGCNAISFPQVIKEGERRSLLTSNAAWSSAALAKSQFRAELEAGNSFMLANASQITPQMALFISQLESFFKDDHIHADVHLYVSCRAGANSYNAHRDLPQHKLLLQAEGEVVWQIFELKQEITSDVRAILPEDQEDFLELTSEFSLTKGDLLYMPPGVFHRVTQVLSPRISISIPFYSSTIASPMDRSFIPFADMFRAKVNAGGS